MRALPSVHVATRAAWRAWLARNHAVSAGVWLVSYKKHTGKRRVEYEDAVQEAICYGWIDSLIKRIDEDRAAQLFTPRKAGSSWSPSNVARFAKLVREGRMTAAGRAHGPTAKTKARPVDNVAAGDITKVPPAIARALKARAAAWKNFRSLTQSQRGLYVRWIDAAKRQDTRDRRIEDAIARLERNEKIGLK